MNGTIEPAPLGALGPSGGALERVSDGGPRVSLRRLFIKPYDGAIAAARTCYAERVIGLDEITPGQRRRIGPLTYAGGHHTVFQHSTFEFALEGVSRQLVWSFLHRQPFYNSEQQSQRYVRLDQPFAHVPAAEGPAPLAGDARAIYESAILVAWRGYRDLGALLEPVARERLRVLWKLDRRRAQSSFRGAIDRDVEKRAIETARYVLPVACHTALVHTISGIVLHRLRRMVNASDAPLEAREVVGQMVSLVEQEDPDFFRYTGEPPLDEQEILESRASVPGPVSWAWRAEFDRTLGARRSLLVSYSPDAPARVAEAVRSVLGRAQSELSDTEAHALALDPARNPHRLDILNVSMHSPVMLALEHAHYTFRKKLSHSADSQDQRHRMVPGSRPLLSRHDTSEPDVVVPELIDAQRDIRQRFDDVVGELWHAKNALVGRGLDVRLAQYLLPNARAIRFEESGSLLHLVHKWTTRTCLNAQREIYEASMDELEQLRQVHPQLAGHVGPPCCVRDGRANPRCTEGTHFCGVPVWRSFPNVQRTI
jgi:thymidylate synthase ThyX